MPRSDAEVVAEFTPCTPRLVTEGSPDVSPPYEGRAGGGRERLSNQRPNDARSIDWRGWLALAWALWFGWQYAKMVVEQRGAKARALVSGIATAAAPAAPERPVSR